MKVGVKYQILYMFINPFAMKCLIHFPGFNFLISGMSFDIIFHSSSDKLSEKGVRGLRRSLIGFSVAELTFSKLSFRLSVLVNVSGDIVTLNRAQEVLLCETNWILQIISRFTSN